MLRSLYVVAFTVKSASTSPDENERKVLDVSVRSESSLVRRSAWPGLLGLAAVGGALFGMVVSVVNGAGVPVLVPVSLIIGVGWSWAGMAFLLGRLSQTRLQGAVPGGLGLVTAVCGYYAVDVVKGVYNRVDQHGPASGATVIDWGSFLNNVLFWSIAALIVGPVFGLVGRGSHRSSTAGLVCQLTVPVIAAAEMVYRLRHDLGLTGHLVLTITWSAVLVVALLTCVLLIVRHTVWHHRHDSAR